MTLLKYFLWGNIVLLNSDNDFTSKLITLITAFFVHHFVLYVFNISVQETHAAGPGNARVFSVEIQRNITPSKLTASLSTSSDQTDGNETSKIKDFPFKVVTHLTSTGTATVISFTTNKIDSLEILKSMFKNNHESYILCLFVQLSIYETYVMVLIITIIT